MDLNLYGSQVSSRVLCFRWPVKISATNPLLVYYAHFQWSKRKIIHSACLKVHCAESRVSWGNETTKKYGTRLEFSSKSGWWEPRRLNRDISYLFRIFSVKLKAPSIQFTILQYMAVNVPRAAFATVFANFIALPQIFCSVKLLPCGSWNRVPFLIYSLLLCVYRGLHGSQGGLLHPDWSGGFLHALELPGLLGGHLWDPLSAGPGEWECGGGM